MPLLAGGAQDVPPAMVATAAGLSAVSVQGRLGGAHGLQRHRCPAHHPAAHTGQPTRAVWWLIWPQVHHLGLRVAGDSPKRSPTGGQRTLNANNAGDWLARVVKSDPLQDPGNNPGPLLPPSPHPMEAGTAHLDRPHQALLAMISSAMFRGTGS